MKYVPLCFFHLLTNQKSQQPREQPICQTDCNQKEQNDNQDDTKVFEHGAGRRPSNFSEFRPTSAEPCAHSLKKSRLFLFSLSCHRLPRFLFSLFVNRMFLAESAIFFKFDTVRGVFLIFHIVIVALFALCASKSNFDSSALRCHKFISRITKKFTPDTSAKIYYHTKTQLSNVLHQK